MPEEAPQKVDPETTKVQTDFQTALSIWNDFKSFIEKIKCLFHGGCHNELHNAALKTGFAGYSRQKDQDWYYYLNSGEHLSWSDPSVELANVQPNSAALYWPRSEYFHQFKNEVSHCCLRSKWPPRELFPNIGTQADDQIVRIAHNYKGTTYVVYWDKDKLDSDAVRAGIENVVDGGSSPIRNRFERFEVSGGSFGGVLGDSGNDLLVFGGIGWLIANLLKR